MEGVLIFSSTLNLPGSVGLRRGRQCAAYCAHGAESRGIVKAEDSLWLRLRRKQLPGCFVAAILTTMIPRRPERNNVSGQGGHVVGRQNPPVAFEAADGCADLRTTDVSNLPASLLDEVRRVQGANRLVVDADEVCLKSLETSIDQDVWGLVLFDHAKAVDRPLCGSNQNDVTRRASSCLIS